MAKYVNNKKPIGTIVNKIQEEMKNNPDLAAKAEQYREKLGNWVDRHFPDMTGNEDLFSNYVQLGSTSFSEVLKGRKATKEQQLTILSALAASMELEDKKDAFQIFLPDGKGKVKRTPIVEPSDVSLNGQKVKVSLWDSFCNMIGYKTKQYKAYEAQQKQEEMAQQLQRAEQFKLKAKEMFAQKHVNEKVEQDKAFWNDAQAKIADENKRMCKLMFGTEKVEDWELRDGSKLSAMSVAVGVLNSKEVGNPNILNEMVEDFDAAVKKYPQEIEKASKICQNLLNRRERAKENYEKYKDDILFERQKFSKEMQRELLDHLMPAEGTKFDSMKSRKAKLAALDETAKDYPKYCPYIAAKWQLQNALQVPTYERSQSEEIVREKMYNTALELDAYKAFQRGDMQKAAQLNNKMLKSQIYADGLMRISANQILSANRGRRVTELSKKDMKMLKDVVDMQVENRVRSNDTNPKKIVLAGCMLMKNETMDYIKLSLSYGEGNSYLPNRLELFTPEIMHKEDALDYYEQGRPYSEKMVETIDKLRASLAKDEKVIENQKAKMDMQEQEKSTEQDESMEQDASREDNSMEDDEFNM